MITNISKKRINILFIHHAIGWGGAPNSMIHLILGLNKSRYKVQVLLLKNSIVSQKLDEYHIEYKIASSFFYRYIYKYTSLSKNQSRNVVDYFNIIRCRICWYLSNNFFAMRELQKFNADIIHLNSSVLTDWLKPCHAIAKTIMHIRETVYINPDKRWDKYLKKTINKYADQIVAISKDSAESLDLLDKTIIIYNYSYITEMDELPISRYYSKKVLYLGGTNLIKGFEIMVKSLDYITEDVVILFGGYMNTGKHNKHKILRKILNIFTNNYNNDRYIIEHLLKQLQFYNNVEIIDMQHNIIPFLDEIVCLVSPFKIPHFSRPVIEAFARRKSAIATRIRGMDEIIDDEINGILVTPDDPQDLANAINKLVHNPALAKEYGDNGYKKACELFSQNNIKQFENIYDKLTL